MSTSTVGRKEVSSAGRMAFTIVAAVVGLLTGGLGGVMYLGAYSTVRTVHRLHDVAPALMLLLVFAVGSLALLWNGARPAPMQQMIAGVAALLTASVASGRVDRLAVVLVLLVAVLAVLHPARDSLLLTGIRPNWLVLGVAVAGAIPLMWFAVGQVALQRSAVGADAHGTESHYAGMAAAVLTFAVVALVASLRTEGWRVPAWAAALGVGLLGVASLSTPRLPGSFGSPGAAVAVAGATTFLVAVEYQARAHRRLPRSSETTSVAAGTARADGAT